METQVLKGISVIRVSSVFPFGDQGFVAIDKDDNSHSVHLYDLNSDSKEKEVPSSIFVRHGPTT